MNFFEFGKYSNTKSNQIKSNEFLNICHTIIKQMQIYCIQKRLIFICCLGPASNQSQPQPQSQPLPQPSSQPQSPAQSQSWSPFSISPPSSNFIIPSSNSSNEIGSSMDNGALIGGVVGLYCDFI
jgi:hypothetical protein